MCWIFQEMITHSSSASTREFVSESSRCPGSSIPWSVGVADLTVTGSPSSRRYDSDTFHSTITSETCTLDHSRGSDSHDYHSASPLRDAHSSSTCTQVNQDDTGYEERPTPSHIDPADDQQCAPMQLFLTRKLELLREKIDTRTNTDGVKEAGESTGQALMQSNVSLKHSSKIAKRAYTDGGLAQPDSRVGTKAVQDFTDACLARLKHDSSVHEAECSSSSHPSTRRPAHEDVDTTRTFTAQYEKLKLESLQCKMETQIEVSGCCLCDSKPIFIM